LLIINLQVLLQAGLFNDGSAQCFANYRWSPKFITKSQAQIQEGQAMVQLDNEYTGDDFSASIKAMNPSILDGSLTGIFIGSYLQSITPRVSLGAEGVWQRQAINARPETAISYCGRYKGDDWIASAQYLAQGVLNVSYWRQLTAQVEAGVDTQLQFSPGLGGNGGMLSSIRREGTTTIGAKYDFRASTFRAQIDSTGKVGCYLEKRVAPVVTMTFAGEIDQVKVRNFFDCVDGTV
jgi:mitochondrial import receptor subunit TOM40